MASDGSAASNERTPLLPGTSESHLKIQHSCSRLLPGSREVKQESDRIERTAWLADLGICSIAAFWFFSGIAYFVRVEGYTFTRAFYVCAQVVTTIGYGDFNFVSDWGETFMCVYIVGCVLLVAWGLGQIIDGLSNLQSGFFMRRIREQRKKRGEAVEDEDNTQMFGEYSDIVASSFICMFFVLFGAVFFHFWENCTCMKTGSPIPGCVQANCEATGGSQLRFISALYMSIVTLTTVGFGDRHPDTNVGMLVGTMWMVLGVAATANFVRSFSMHVFHKAQERSYFLNCKISRAMFEKMDADHDGTISRAEFRRYMLLKFQLVDAQILDVIDQQYDALDEFKTNKVSFDDVVWAYDIAE